MAKETFFSPSKGQEAGDGAPQRRPRAPHTLVALVLAAAMTMGTAGAAPAKPTPLLRGPWRVLVLKLTSYTERSLAVGAAKLLCQFGASSSRPRSTSILPDDFPHAYLAEGDDGDYDAILVKRGNRATRTPFTENGKRYWEAYICDNEACPGRAANKQKGKGDRPYIFAAKRPDTPPPPPANEEEAIMMIEVLCPQCKAAYDKAPATEKDRFEPTMVEHYLTEEGMKILEKIREEYRRRSQAGR